MTTVSDRFMERVKKAIQREQERSLYVKTIEDGTGFERFAALREFYANANIEIMQAQPNEWAIDTYEIDWLRVFTPIEFALWQDIRQEGLVMYPQYPVAGYFIDFANPVAKVGIECDGAAYHLDKAKDAARDSKLRALGWSIYRISGKDCKTDFDEVSRHPGLARLFIRHIVDSHNNISQRYK